MIYVSLFCPPAFSNFLQSSISSEFVLTERRALSAAWLSDKSATFVSKRPRSNRCVAASIIAKMFCVAHSSLVGILILKFLAKFVSEST